MGICEISMSLSAIIWSMAMIGQPGVDRDSDSTTTDVAGTLPFLDLRRIEETPYCGIGFRFGHSWRDYLWFESEYSHLVTNSEVHKQSLLLAGVRLGVRKRRLGGFITLRPGVIRGFKSDHPDFNAFKFALSMGGVVEGGYSLTRHNNVLYLRFDLGYLVIWYGDATRRSPFDPPFRPGTSKYPQWSFSLGLRL